MTETAAGLLPLALAIAASPFPIVPAILLLFTPRPLPTAAAFLTGWGGGILAATTAFTLLSAVLEGPGETPLWASWLRIGLGAVLVGLGARQWLGRAEAAEAPAWMTSVETADPAKALRLGVLLSAANPKILVLAAAAGVTLGATDATAGATIALLLLFAALASVTVALPPVLFWVRGDRMLPRLARAKDWLMRNNAAVMAAVLVIIGLALMGKGIGEL